MKRVFDRSVFFVPAVIAVSFWFLAHFASIDYKLFLGDMFSASAAIERGNFHLDAFYDPTASVDYVKGRPSIIRYEDCMRDLPPPTVGKTLFSKEIGAFVEDTGDGYDIAFWIPWWLLFLISLIPIVALALQDRTSRRWTSPIPLRVD